MTSPDKTKLVRLTELLDISLDDLLGSPKRGNASMAVAHAGYGHGLARTGVGAIDLDSALIDQARRLGIDLPTALNEHLRALVARTRSERWLEDMPFLMDVQSNLLSGLDTRFVVPLIRSASAGRPVDCIQCSQSGVSRLSWRRTSWRPCGGVLWAPVSPHFTIIATSSLAPSIFCGPASDGDRRSGCYPVPA
jgi:hypothetical protein